jgi:zinc transport system substrate-binding protein
MKRLILIAATLAGVLVLSVWYFRAGKAPLRSESGKLVVAATIYPLYDIARNVGGDHAAVRVILPPGASPHLFEFSPRQLQGLESVKAVFAIGYGLDGWATQVVNVAPAARVITVDQGIDLRTFADGTTDPHYWLSLGNARKIADTIANALMELDPVQAEAYRVNADAYKEKLSEKERVLKEMLAPARGTSILTFHDAWFYFAESFGLKIAGTFEPSVGEEPRPRYLAELGQKIKAEHIGIIFVEPQLSTGILQSFAKDNHVGIADLDPLGGVERRTTYLELMQFNANSIRRAILERGP